MAPPRDVMTSLPLEILDEILSNLPKETLKTLRLANRTLGLVAAGPLFRSVSLINDEDSPSPDHFVKIATSTTLSRHVREICCSTVVPNFDYGVFDDYPNPIEFFHALEFLRYFHLLESLHFEFDEYLGFSDDYGGPEETETFRTRALITVFECLYGTWSSERRKELEEMHDFECEYPFADFDDWTKVTSPIALRSLRIINLAAYENEVLTDSPCYRLSLETGNLTSLNLHISAETGEQDDLEIGPIEKFPFYEKLPSTWLSAPTVANLRSLTLSAPTYWGWTTKLELYSLGAGRGLPSLKRLSLGKYVFSHQWQVDWIGSLGIKELYLDSCVVLHRAKWHVPLTSRDTVIGYDDGGKVISGEQDLYPPPMLPGSSDEESREPGIYDFPLRWHVIFSQWSKSMHKLQVFDMNHLERLYILLEDKWYEWDEWIAGFIDPEDTGDEWALEQGLMDKDIAALEILRSTIDSRRV